MKSQNQISSELLLSLLNESMGMNHSDQDIRPGASIGSQAIAHEATRWKALSSQERFRAAKDCIREHLQQGWSLCVGSSFGKDSSVLMNLIVLAAKELTEEGIPYEPIIVSHADTGIDAPEMRMHADDEMAKLQVFADRHGIALRIDVVRPGVFNTWAAKIIGGRGLPTFEDSGSRGCTVDLKVQPQERQRKRIISELGKAGNKPLLLLGVRFEESPDRAMRMRERGERADVPFKHDKHWTLSPIAWFDQEDIWTMVAEVQSGKMLGYSDFESLTRIYADAAGSSCFVVGDDVTTALKSKRACGSRTGCSQCQAIGDTDDSMEAMIASDPRYNYLRPLSDLRAFIRNTRFDLSRRNWICREIVDNTIRLKPDVYSPQMCEDLLRMALTIDRLEQIDARRAGLNAPRFTLLSHQDLVAIDFQWSRYGLHPPFHAWVVAREVWDGRNTLYPPSIEPGSHPRVKGMSTIQGVFHVDFEMDRFDGISDLMYQGFASACGFDSKESKYGTITDYGQSDVSEIDEESIVLLEEFELDRLIEVYHRQDVDPTHAARFYLQYGTVSLSAKGTSANDVIMRRTQALWRAGLTGQQDPKWLIDRSRPAAEPKDSAQVIHIPLISFEESEFVIARNWQNAPLRTDESRHDIWIGNQPESGSVRDDLAGNDERVDDSEQMKLAY